MTDVPSVALNKEHRIPMIGLGTWQIACDVAGAVIERALEMGYRYIDCAYGYQNEGAIGLALTQQLSAGKIKREELFIATKLPPNGLHKNKVKHFLQLSLKKLFLDYVDLYLIHFPVGCQYFSNDFMRPNYEFGQLAVDPDTNLVDVWKGMEECVDAGLTKTIGVANFNTEQIQRILNNCRIPPSIVQVESHLYFQQKELFEFCGNRGITFSAFAPLGSPRKGDFDKKVGLIPMVRHFPLKDKLVMALAEKYNKTSAQILLKWTVQQGKIAVVKSFIPEHLRENLQIFNFELEDDDVRLLNSLDKNQRVFLMINSQRVLDHPEYPF